MRIRLILGSALSLGALAAFAASGSAAQTAVTSLMGGPAASHHAAQPATSGPSTFEQQIRTEQQTEGKRSARAKTPQVSVGPSVFEQQTRAQQPQPAALLPQQVSVGPSVFEQQIRNLPPSPRPGAIPSPGPIHR